jgi:hypothetical protein
LFCARVQVGYRHTEFARRDVDEPHGAKESKVPIGHGCAARVHNDSAIGQPPHHWDVRVPAYRDIDPAAKSCVQLLGNDIVGESDNVFQVMG